MNRSCGGCTLCCKLLPVPELEKLANERCRHQRTGKGCAVYASPAMPMACKLWTCRWLVDPMTATLRRPDRAHYVLDIMACYITMRDNDTGEVTQVPTVQVWVDPAHRDAHRDPELRAYLDFLGKTGIAATVRYSATEAFVIFPPSMTGRGWPECESEMLKPAAQPDRIADSVCLAAVSTPTSPKGQGPFKP